MPKAKIKKEHLDTQVGYNNSGLPFRFRDDWDVLAEEALRTNDPSLLNLFEQPMPTIKQLKEEAGEKFLEANPAPVVEPKK